MEKLGLYIHIPFCEKKCHYCDFLTFINKDENIDIYIKYLKKEIDLYKNQNIILDTVYIGGGTPSYIHENLIQEIMDRVRSIFIIDKNAEITIEMNPESVSEEKIKKYLEIGINRFSMGVQSFDDEVLKIMGRLHNSKTVFKKLKLMRKLGCKNISIDLMLANPKQDMKVLKNDLEIASKLDIDHISYYSLILKERTHFDMWYNEGKIELFDPMEERKMYHLVLDELKKNGYEHYEISSFSKKGFQSKHNKKYWNLKSYIGLGMGAASNINLVRMENHRDFEKYFNDIDDGKKPILEYENLDIDTREKEYIMLNLRMMKGFSLKDFEKTFGVDFLYKYEKIARKYIENGFIRLEDGNIHFTDYGIDNGTILFRDLYNLE